MLLGLALLSSAAAASAAVPATPLFAGEEPIRLTLRGPISAVAGGNSRPRDAVLTLAGTPEALAVRISPRGLTRRNHEICQFAPMRVELTQPPPAGSLFAGQRRLKLVTHCRARADFQRHLLLEYAAYKLYNALTPASYRVRLAEIDYVDDSGKPITSRLGFFIEDIDDVARRNGVRSPSVGREVPMSALDPSHATRVALFNYMIGNLDWSARAGPAGDECCHNARLIGRGASGGLVPVPYDFDFSGLVGAPYALPPDGLPVRNVRNRYYRGYCAHNGEARAIAAEFRTRRPQLLAVLSQLPRLEDRARAKAVAYLDGFFADIADDDSLTRKVLRTCS